MQKTTIYFDGGCTPNPGEMEICIVVVEAGTKTPSVMKKLGYGTNNIAEWSALIWALDEANKRNLTDVEFIGDSKLVVNQANGSWKINNQTFLPFKAAFDEGFKPVGGTVSYIPRDSNLAGNYLEFGRL